ncbi:tRNA synthetase class I (I- L- M and V) family protein [Striga hermonthica]|uniref:tRNA synthetase class I (I- L- M and V) family protein n=1 Tax=Striga hermonthica TaxID=68872 RepID=A0A9N7NCY7_STRHE|nr:tRNA synthetase class I (I- L- M and V) family protein [Striga hermonthica]
MEEVSESNRYCFPAEEEKILAWWEKIQAFHKVQQRTEGKPEFVFYDGPPFATGSPHYGHILAGTIKDIVCRYRRMNGNHVNILLGFDCHGVPVENEIRKKLNIVTRKDVVDMGIESYNKECRALVTNCVDQWESVVIRSGRSFGSFKDGYKTMDFKFMETVWRMNGNHVNILLGFDCHGVPVENEIRKKLNIVTRKDVVDMGIESYNKECRALVTNCVDQWESVVIRSGRSFGSFKDGYKTMDFKFMETVWWVFSQLHHKGLVYRAFKVSPYSTTMETPLSNFEADSDKRFVTDPSIIVSFPIITGPHRGAAFVAWTTTPWTLPSNLALCVNPDLPYVKVRNKFSGNIYLVAECRLSELPAEKPNSLPKSNLQAHDCYHILDRFSGLSLVNTKYQPMFEYFVELSDVAFRVVADSSVSDQCGTGIVHYAPQFGEDDFRVCLENGIISQGQDLIVPLDSGGRFTDKIPEYEGRFIKDVEVDIVDAVKTKGRFLKSGTIQHIKAFGSRSDKPLIHKACLSWFLEVEKFKDQLLEANKQTYWVPDFVKDKRFHNWLENARDWAISRNRFWGTPVPVWISEDGKEIVVVDSAAKLERLSGKKV